MDDLNQSTEELNISLNKTKNEVELLARSLDLKRVEFTEATTQQLEALDAGIKSIEKETLLLHSLPKKLSTQIIELIPHIAIELNKLNQNEIKNLKIAHANSIEEQNKAVESAAFRLNQIKEEIEKIDSQRIKRYFLGLGVVVLISISASLGATYTMIRMFPQYVNIQSPNNITVQESEVSLWSSKNVNISGDVKRRGQR
jgi:hypothetical protein